MQAERKRASVLYFVASVVGAALFVTAATVRLGGPVMWPAFVFFYALHLLGLATSVEVPLSGITEAMRPPRPITLSPGFIVLLTAAYTLNPATAVLVALVPSLPVNEWRRRPDITRLLFNSSQESISFAGAAVTFALLHRGQTGIGRLFLAAAVAAVVAEVLNTSIVAGVVALDRDMRFRDAARRMAWTIPHSLSFAVAALLVATLYDRFGPAAAAFLFMPLVALRFVRQGKLDLDVAHAGAIREFVRAVERKDPYTRNHSERVAEIAVAIHRELGTPDRLLARRYYAGLIHDVGKIVVPAEILTKPGALTDIEYDVIKSHVTVGADAVRKIGSFADLVDEVLHHHERFDGRGYPDGLEGEQIPRNARILAVADCFEAMTSARVYRGARSVVQAIEELRRIAGSQLDPEPVAALLRVLESGVVFAPPGPRHVLQSVEREAMSDVG